MNLHKALRQAGFYCHAHTVGGVQGVDVYDPLDWESEKYSDEVTGKKEAVEIVVKVFSLNRFTLNDQSFLLVPQHGQPPYIVDLASLEHSVQRYVDHPCVNGKGCKCRPFDEVAENIGYIDEGHFIAKQHEGWRPAVRDSVDQQIDRLHGPGAVAAIEAAYGDGSIFGDDQSGGPAHDPEGRSEGLASSSGGDGPGNG